MSRGAVIGLSFFLGLFCVVHTANGKSVDPTLIRRLGTEHEVLSCGGCTWSLTANGTLRMTGTSDCGSGCPSRFDFNDLGITTIDPSAFNSTGLQHATTLSVSHNPLQVLTEGVFDKLIALKTLYLDGNQLETLPAGIFDELTGLDSLFLQNNKLIALPLGLFDRLTSLTVLSLEGNQLTSLNAGVFDKLAGLIILSLDGNRLSSLPSEVFDQLTSLVILSLNSNRLDILPVGAFDKLASLGSLALQDNQLESLNAGALDQLAALTVLKLPLASQFDCFVSIPPSTTVISFSGDSSQEAADNDRDKAPYNDLPRCGYGLHLYTCGGCVWSKADGVLSMTGAANCGTGCPLILNFTGMALTSIDLGAFNTTGMQHVTNLDLSHNDLAILPAGIFDELTGLDSLLLQNNKLSALPMGIFDRLTLLTVLSLEGNQLTSLNPGVFDKLAGLTNLKLQGNDLGTLPPGVFDKLAGLTNLWLPSATKLPCFISIEDSTTGALYTVRGTFASDGLDGDQLPQCVPASTSSPSLPSSSVYIASMKVRVQGSAASFDVSARKKFQAAVLLASPLATLVTITSLVEESAGSRQLRATSSCEIGFELSYEDKESAESALAGDLTEGNLNTQMRAAGLDTLTVAVQPEVRSKVETSNNATTTPAHDSPSELPEVSAAPTWLIPAAVAGGVSAMAIVIVGCTLYARRRTRIRCDAGHSDSKTAGGSEETQDVEKGIQAVTLPSIPVSVSNQHDTTALYNSSVDSQA